MEHHADLSKTHTYRLVCDWIPNPNKNKCFTVHRDAITKEFLELVFDEAYETYDFSNSNIIDNVHDGLIDILLDMNISVFENLTKTTQPKKLFIEHVRGEQIAYKLWNVFKQDWKDYPECLKVECQNNGEWRKETNTFNNMWNNLGERMWFI